jgi:hypothetical protein
MTHGEAAASSRWAQANHTAVGLLAACVCARGRAAGGKPRGLLEQGVAAMQAWMMRIIQQHGFLGILLLASWPNAAFDLCGICCGVFLMPFWTFFGATLVGKGLFKVSGQAMFFVALFRCAPCAEVLPGRGCCCAPAHVCVRARAAGCKPPAEPTPTHPPAPPPVHLASRNTPGLTARPPLVATHNTRRRQASRNAILHAVARLLPSSLPFGLSRHHDSPAEALMHLIDSQIGKFQARVTAKAQEHRAETRWWWQRRLDTFVANFR